MSSEFDGLVAVSQGQVVVPTAGQPVQLPAGQYDTVEIFARGTVDSANVGGIKLGTEQTRLRVLKPGQWKTFKAPHGKKIELSHIWIDAFTDGDGVTWTATS